MRTGHLNLVTYAVTAAILLAPVAAFSQQPASPPADPKLEVASVKATDGHRASKVIGTSVYNEQNQQIGAVDDLILSGQDKVAFIVVSVGGFLGMGGRLVAIPFERFQGVGSSKLTVPNASADELKAMPTFTYAG